MSIFATITATCPSCQEALEINAVESVNADRRPDLRSAILDRTFQIENCAKCQARFRLDPSFNYLDVGRGQWTSAQPLDRLDGWIEGEDEATSTFALAYGDAAPRLAREIGASLRPRLVYGWAALREKLVAADLKLDDVALELLKLALIQSLDNVPLRPGMELRLEDSVGDELELDWIRAASDEVVERLRVPRAMYDGIVNDPAAWAPLRKALEQGPFVDMQKLYFGPGRASA